MLYIRHIHLKPKVAEIIFNNPVRTAKKANLYHHKYQSVQAVQGNNRSLHKESYRTHKHRVQPALLIVEAGGAHILASRLCRVKLMLPSVQYFGWPRCGRDDMKSQTEGDVQWCSIHSEFPDDGSDGSEVINEKPSKWQTR
jgi:hypothetical protein